MSEPATRPFISWAKDWTQTIAIGVTFLWGAYTFIYKDIVVPKSAPVNISMNLTAERIPTEGARTDLIPIQLKVAAKNPSTRNVYLPRNIWFARGTQIESVAADQAPVSLEGGACSYSDSKVFAGGQLFRDEVLKPGEAIQRTLVFFVPADRYDVVEVGALVPATSREGRRWPLSIKYARIRAEWEVKGDVVTPTLYWESKNKKHRTPIKRNEAGGYSVPAVESQMAESFAEVYLPTTKSHLGAPVYHRSANRAAACQP